MTLLGKLLLVFNLAAVGAFAYLATQNWRGRQAITAAGVRHVLVLSGLPLEGPDAFQPDPDGETPFRVELAGGVATETISKKVLDLYFQQAPGGPVLGDPNGTVPSQIAEVKRVKAKIAALLQEKADRTDKVALLAGWLIFQCETLDERVEIQTLYQKADAGELEKRLMAKFDAVINAPPKTTALALTDPLPDLEKVTRELNALVASKATDTELTAKRQEVQEAQKKIDDRMAAIAASRAVPLDEVERRVRIAHLLSHLSQDAAWQKRVMMVVGLRRYVGVIAAQAVRFQVMSEAIEKLIVADQTGFLGQEADLNMLSRMRTVLKDNQAKLKQEKIDQVKKDNDALAQREDQLAAIKTQLLKVKADVDETLVKQGAIEAGLFEVQREVAITLDEVYELEARLEKLELELAAAAKKTK